MGNKPSNQEPDEIGKPHARPGERARDEQRERGGPAYGGEAWEVADERGDQRFGHARNDDADPSELKPGEGAVDDDEWPNAAGAGAEQTAATDDGSAETGGQRAGFGHGEKPTKDEARTKKNPQSGSKRKTDRG